VAHCVALGGNTADIIWIFGPSPHHCRLHLRSRAQEYLAALAERSQLQLQDPVEKTLERVRRPRDGRHLVGAAVPRLEQAGAAARRPVVLQFYMTTHLHQATHCTVAIVGASNGPMVPGSR
jgi:hypothetical protein